MLIEEEMGGPSKPGAPLPASYSRDVMTEQLKKLVELARARQMTPAEREEQLRNFAAGNVGLENERVTRAVVDEAARRIGPR